MCWSATTSFITLGVGSVLNLASWLILRNVFASPVAVVVWWWQYGLLMQIPEGIAWLQLDNGETNIEAASRAAMVLNITQPVALFVGLWLSPLHTRSFRYAHVALFLYLLVIASEFDVVWPESSTIAPKEGCQHLNLGYWDTSRGILYAAASLLIISEARPLYWAIINACIFSATLTLSIVVYPCGVGSVWCWFIFMAGPILVAAEWFRVRFLHGESAVEVVTSHPPTYFHSRPNALRVRWHNSNSI